jgi:serine/threonine protein kinase
MSIKQVEGYTIYLSQVLGRGSYGNVYRGMKEASQDPVAVKVIPKELGKAVKT